MGCKVFGKFKNKIKKKKIKKIKVKMNRSSKKLIAIILLIIGFLLLLVLIGMFFPGFASWFLINIRNPIIGILFDIGQHIPFVASRFMIIIIFIMFVLIGTINIIEDSKKLSYFKKEKYANNCLKVTFILMFICSFSFLFDLISLNSLKMNYDNENFNKSYSKEDLINLNKELADKIMMISSEMEREDGAIKYDKDIVDVAVNNLLGISDDYDFLKGRYPNKVSDFYKHDRSMNNDGTVGYTMMYAIFIDKELEKLSQLSTVTHELCHAKGLTRESETEFCSYVAGVESSDKLSQYASYLNGFMRANDVLYMVDEDVADDIEEPIQNMCLNNEYEEICGIYLKMLSTYISDSDELWLSSYRLRNYNGHDEKIIGLLSELDEKFDVKFLINNKKVNLNKIEQEINSGSENKLRVVVSIDEDNFDKISKVLMDYKKYFYSIYQMNSEVKDDDIRTGNEALEFYLSPFNKKYDTFMYFTNDYMDEYDYSRMTRLLLEYYY